ncbi:MAG: YnbE family lipoprotein [Hyphomonadaceae bacterium]
MRHIVILVSLTALSFGAIGCVRIMAPDRPIEINLNVNIRQEVIVRLEGQARDLLESNPDLF